MHNIIELPIWSTDEQYLTILKTIRYEIQKGKAWDFRDLSTRLTCSWGLQEKSLKDYGVHANQLRLEHSCPLQGARDENDYRGCYYRCLVWNFKFKLTRQEALALYDEKINTLSQHKRRIA